MHRAPRIPSLQHLFSNPQYLAGSIRENRALTHHLLGCTVHLFPPGASGHRDLARVQGHVTSLDALSSESSDCGQILCQSHCGDDLGQFSSAFDPQNLERHAR